MALFTSGGKMEKKRRSIHSRDMPNFNRNDTDKRKVIKDKKSILKSGGKVIAQKKMLESVEQLDGGKEIREASVTASVITKPFTKVAKITRKNIKEQVKQKHIKEEHIKSVRGKNRSKKKQLHSKDSNNLQKKEKNKTVHRKDKSVKSDYRKFEQRSKENVKRTKDVGSDKVKKQKLNYVLSKLKNNKSDTSANVKTLDSVKNILIKAGMCLLPFALVLLMIVCIAAIIIALVIALIYNSPFSIFFPPLENGDTIMTVTSQYVAEFNREINTLVSEHKECDIGKIVYKDYEGTSNNPSNYYDVMSVYMVKYGIGNTATVMNENAKTELKTVFDDMCTYTTSINEEKIKNDKGKKEKKKVLYVNVSLKTYYQMETEYSMNENEIELLNSLMSSDAMLALGYNNGNSGTVNGGNKKSSLSQEEINEILNGVTDINANAVCSFVLSKVGYPYSQPLRNSGTHFDCSSLAYYAWKSAGISVMCDGANTAAAEAKWCNDNGCVVKETDLKPGDLIFYSYSNNGRYKNISHVGIYVGKGKMVEAVDEATGVVLQDYYNGSLVMIGRPNKNKK